MTKLKERGLGSADAIAIPAVNEFIKAAMPIDMSKPIATTDSESAKPIHLQSIDSLRGMAILLVISGHVTWVANWHIDTFPEKVVYNLITGGTSYFVFITGFLFHYLSIRGFNYRRFLARKAELVLLPYLIMSAVPLLYYFGIRQKGPPYDRDAIFPSDADAWSRFFFPSIDYLLTGKHLCGYWYVPFIMTMFALSPAFIAYIKLRLRTRFLIMGATLLIASLVHRPVENLAVVQSVIYFAPVYLLGINVSMHREQVLRSLSGKEWILGLAVLGLSMMQIVFFQQHGNMHKRALEWGGFDLTLLSKMTFCLLVYSLFSRVEKLNHPALKRLASASFPLYFLHPLVIKILVFFICTQSLFEPLPEIVSWVIWTFVITIMSYLTAVVIRWLIPGISRRMIGW